MSNSSKNSKFPPPPQSLDEKMQNGGDDRIPPKIPPRTHAVHVRNRLRCQMMIEQSLCPDTECFSDDVAAPCRSRKASSVGFVEIDDLLKFQEEYKTRCSSRLYSSLRNLFSTGNSNSLQNSSDHQTVPESHINPMFSAHKCSISRSFTHLPYPPKKKRKSHLKRVFSCFSIFKP